MSGGLLSALGNPDPVSKIYCVTVKKPIEFMESILHSYCGNARLSLEGELDVLRQEPWPGASKDETNVLKRNTISPEHDFLVLPLAKETLPALLGLMRRIGLRRNVWHLQIERDGHLCFAAYDSFAQNCVWVEAAFGDHQLATLQQQGVITSYTADEQGARGSG